MFKWDLGSIASFFPGKPGPTQAESHTVTTGTGASPALLRPNYDLRNAH